MRAARAFLLVVLAFGCVNGVLGRLRSDGGSLLVGTAMRDITGPTSEVNLMGYANPAQVAGGVHMRLFARAFVFEDGATGKHFAFVSADIGMGSDLVNAKVVERLDALLGEGVYTLENICISGTHTHSGPAGFLQYTLFQVTSLGFMNQTFTTFVDGIADAIAAAHQGRRSGRVGVAQAELEDSNINRSPTSYLLNPEDERAEYDADTDLNMLLLRVQADDGTDMGALNWFAVHGTSLNNTNRLLSGDNRGYASYLLERDYNGATADGVLPGQGDFVAAFASSNLGDVSPNTDGAKCIHSGLPCDPVTSTCHGRNEACIAFGPGTNGDMYESAAIIGTRQYTHATGLMEAAASSPLTSTPVDYRHLFVNMSDVAVALSDGTTARTCRPAMGYAFAAGTTDGPGMFNFHQAMNNTTPFWTAVSDVLSTPSPAEVACQAPKPILLDLSGIERPYQWDTEVVPVQLLRLGSLFIAAVPSEFTTMAGRRLRNTIEQTLRDEGVEGDIYVAIAGLANSYSDYVTTFEEYQGQRYEAASTIFGPHSHAAYLQLFQGLARDLATGQATPQPEGVAPPDLSDQQLQLIPDQVAFDSVPSGASFGQTVSDVDTTKTYAAGDTLEATFWGSNPRGDLRTGDTYLAVERRVDTTDQARRLGSGSNSGHRGGGAGSKHHGLHQASGWQRVAVDGDPETRFIYHRVLSSTGAPHPEGPLVSDRQALSLKGDSLHHSQVTLWWQVPNATLPGEYRLRYFGQANMRFRGPEAFEGVSSVFTVTA